MTLYDNHETFPGARSGVWHLHDRPAGKQRPAVNVAPKTAVIVSNETVEPVAIEAVNATQGELL